MSLIALVATDDEGGIGKNNTLPWRCPEDLQLFKEKTQGKAVVMGRKTLESLPNGKPLPNRVNIVMTRKVPENPIEGVIYCTDKQRVLEKAKNGEIFVIGGAEIYALFGDFVDELHETNIDGDYDCDTSFPYEAFPDDYKISLKVPNNFKGSKADGITIYKFIK